MMTFKEQCHVRVRFEKEAGGLRYALTVGDHRISDMTREQAEAVCDALAHAQNVAIRQVQHAMREAIGLTE